MNGNHKGRKNWTLSMTIATVIAVICVFIGFLFTGTDEDQADRMYFNASAGSVLFDHGQHQQVNDDCASCHHDLLSAKQATACADCHNEEMAADDFEHSELKEFHSRDCLRCHELSADAKEPSSCRECHESSQESELQTVSCQECHSDDFTPDLMTHDEYQDIDDHSCLGCHNPASVSEAYHTNCTGCHLSAAPEKFADTSGAVQCKACHLR